MAIRQESRSRTEFTVQIRMVVATIFLISGFIIVSNPAYFQVGIETLLPQTTIDWFVAFGNRIVNTASELFYGFGDWYATNRQTIAQLESLANGYTQTNLPATAVWGVFTYVIIKFQDFALVLGSLTEKLTPVPEYRRGGITDEHIFKIRKMGFWSAVFIFWEIVSHPALLLASMQIADWYGATVKLVIVALMLKHRLRLDAHVMDYLEEKLQGIKASTTRLVWLAISLVILDFGSLIFSDLPQHLDRVLLENSQETRAAQGQLEAASALDTVGEGVGSTGRTGEASIVPDYPDSDWDQATQITDSSETHGGQTVAGPQGVEATESLGVAEFAPLQESEPRSRILATTQFVVTFPIGSAELTEVEDDQLQELMSFLNEKDIERLDLAGFADPRGESQSNRELSIQRAETIAELLRENGAPEPSSVTGRGEEDWADIEFPEVHIVQERFRQERRVEVLIEYYEDVE